MNANDSSTKRGGSSRRGSRGNRTPRKESEAPFRVPYGVVTVTSLELALSLGLRALSMAVTVYR